MKTHVAAVVVSHDSPEFLSATLKGLAHQTRKPDQLIIIDTGVTGACDELIANSGAFVETGVSLNGAIEKAMYKIIGDLSRNSSVADVDLETTWMWLLHDDSAPTLTALAELLKAVEVSPSVAIAGPKQLDWNDPKKIFQQGLSLTKTGALFSFVSGELDQAQHDEMSDVLAVGTAGALYKVSVLEQLGGFAKEPLFADVDFSMRARLAGHRVIVVPQARVVHAGLSLRGKRDRAWLGASPKTALRKAEVAVRFAYAPLAQVLLYWFFLPLVTLARVIWRIAAKRPDRIASEMATGIWGYFTVWARLSYRREISRIGRAGIAATRRLRPTRQQQRDAARRNAEQEEIEARIEAHAQLAEIDRFGADAAAPKTEEILYGSISTSKTFAQSGAWFFVAALAILSFAWWPTGEAISGGGAISLGGDWFEIFRRAGASFNPIGHGFIAPADAFIWVLTAISATTFWAPSLSIAILFLLAKPIAFVGGYRFASLFSQKAWLRNLGGLLFAVWPAVTIAQNELRLPALIAQLTLPFLLFAVARAALIGEQIDLRSSKQVWSWVGIAGLALATVLAAAPSAFAVLAIGFAAVLIWRFKRAKYLIYIALPSAALFSPTILYFAINLGQPLALFADPGLAQASQAVEPWQLLFGSTAAQSPWFAALLTLPVLLIGVGALLVRRSAVAVWALALIAVASAWMFTKAQFAAVGVAQVDNAADFVNGSPAALTALAGLLIIGLAVTTLDEISNKRARQLLAITIAALTIAPLAAVIAISPNQASWSTARTMPAIIAAEAKAGSAAQVLVISADATDQYSAAVMSVDGLQLEDTSVAYRFALHELQKSSKDFEQVATLVANLISANGENLSAEFADAKIKYVLVSESVSDADANLSVALDSAAELESAGLTDAGRLWRVKDSAVEISKSSESPWSVTKAVQLAILIAFILLALPSSGSARASRKESEIFVAAEGGDAE